MMDTEPQGRSRPVVSEAVAILLAGGLVGLAANAWGPWRIPWSLEADRLTALRAAVAGLEVLTEGEAAEDWRTGRSLWVDARPAADYAKGHVPWAISLPVPAVEGWRPDRLPFGDFDQPLLIHGRGGLDEEALRVAGRLKAMGFRSVRIWAGGVRAWTNAGRPLEKAEGG